MPVEQGRQVPAPGEGGHLVRMHLGELDAAAEADQEPGPDKVTGRCSGHPRPAHREGYAQSLRQPVGRHPGPALLADTATHPTGTTHSGTRPANTERSSLPDGR
ncbi:hypothetical protein ACFWBC_13755 [Streptomyces sp. NPDC059985]|uniref:hypothetical protein n=1 Tax=Streptomyces sp. NPDC059985 TaxID=3347025 RepID=UPI0036C38E86